MVVAYILYIFSVINRRMFNLSIFWTIFWLIFIVFWAFEIPGGMQCLSALRKNPKLILSEISVFYNIPYFIGNLTFYLYKKQRSLIKKLSLILSDAEKFLNKNPYRKLPMAYVKYAHVNRFYGKLLCEINDYNQIISRYLDISFFLFITIVAYLTFLLFFNETNLITAVVFANVYASHLTILCCLILACSTITKGNEAMSKRTLQLFNISLKRHFHAVQLMKVCPRGMNFVLAKNSRYLSNSLPSSDEPHPGKFK